MKRFLALGLVALVVFGAADSARAGDYEDDVKAAFLFNFTKLIAWPDSAFDGPTAPLEIGVVGNDRVFRRLKEIIKDRTSQGRPVIVWQLKDSDPATDCHVLFVGGTTDPGELSRWDPVGVLLVGEQHGFASRGGVMNFYLEDNRVRFEVNREAAERTGIRISSKLLALARIVDPEDAP